MTRVQGGRGGSDTYHLFGPGEKVLAESAGEFGDETETYEADIVLTIPRMRKTRACQFEMHTVE